MSDKLVKGSVDVETVEGFAQAIGRAIEQNDVKTAEVLSRELREKLECGATGTNWLSQTYRCSLQKNHGGEHRAELDGRTYTWEQVVQPAVIGDRSASTVKSLFNEGKHLCKLRAVFFERTMNGEPLVCFKLEIVKSRQMATGVEVVHALPSRTDVQTRIVASQLDRLGIDRDALNGTLGSANVNNANIDVVMVAVKKLTKPNMNGEQREVMVTSMRRVDDTDSPWDESW